jgi:nucleotide-binding universal stress UspA family protein
MNAPLILVPLDGSAPARSALPVAHALAPALQASVHVLRVGAEPTPPGDALRALGLDSEQLRGAVLEQRTGDPAAEIVQAARERPRALIALCTCTGQARPSHVLGPVAERVLSESTVPIVFVPPARCGAAFQLRHLLLPHDGTPATSAADRPAAELANAARARLSVLHVAVPGAPLPAEPGSLPVGQYADQPQHEWPEWIDEFLARLTAYCPIDRALLRIHVAHGEPGSEILRFAERHDVDMIVLAFRGAFDAARAATIRSVLRQAACPVMIVRAEH